MLCHSWNCIDVLSSRNFSFVGFFFCWPHHLCVAFYSVYEMWAIVNWQFLSELEFSVASNLKLPVCHFTDVNQCLCALISFFFWTLSAMAYGFFVVVVDKSERESQKYKSIPNMAHCFADNVNAWNTCLVFMDTLLTTTSSSHKRDRERERKKEISTEIEQNDRNCCAVDLWHDMQVFLSFPFDSLNHPIRTATKLLA